MQEKEPQFFGKPETREKPIEILMAFIREMSFELQKDDIPVNEKGRINIDEFKEVYPRQMIEADRDWVKDLRGRWKRAAASTHPMSWLYGREPIQQKLSQEHPIGEVWEMLAMAILHKNLGGDFIVVRTSEYDDAKNGVDSLIIDKKTGSVICAFDEVGVISGPRFEEKKRRVLERNWRQGGADVVYGISFVEKQGSRRLKKGTIDHIPLFYFASSEDTVRKGLETFSKDRASSEEQKIFKGFVASFSEQIKEIEKEPMHSKFRERLEFFEAILGKLKDMLK